MSEGLFLDKTITEELVYNTKKYKKEVRGTYMDENYS